MGRNCGDIALHTALACGAEFVMIPEIPWDIEDIAARMKWGRLNGKRSTILILAEGAYSSLESDTDRICLEHEKLRLLCGASKGASKLAAILEALSGQETRATVLGYIQRGGSPSAFDRALAGRMGEAATRLLRADISGRAIGMRDNQLTDVPFKEAIGPHRPYNAELFDLIGKLAR
jgi:6-phosphofructokinase 1